MCLLTPQQGTSVARPRPVFRARRSTPLGIGCAAARYARLRSASPQWGGGRWKKDNLQKDFYTPLELIQVGRIDDPTGVNFYGFPSIAVNTFNDVLIGHNSFSTNQYASANISLRAFYDAKNQMRPTRIFKDGRDVFIHTRWGDYSSTVIDPLNDSDFWTIQMYAGTNLVSEDYNASIVWAPVSVPVPANDHVTDDGSITGAQGSTNG